MAKKSVIAGEYTIEIADDGHINVIRKHSDCYRPMCEIAAEKGFPVDEKWDVQTLGSKLVTEFGDGKTAKFEKIAEANKANSKNIITINRLPDQKIEIFEECQRGAPPNR